MNSTTAQEVASLTSALRDLAWTMRHTAPSQAQVPSVATSDLAVLKQVLASPGSTVGALAEMLGLQRPNVSTSIRMLEADGLVLRTADPEDRRRTLVHATDRARGESTAIAEAWQVVIAAATADLEPAHRTVLMAAGPALEALNAAVRSRSS